MKCKSTQFTLVIIAFCITAIFALSGCQTASVALDSASAIRAKIAQKETDSAVRRLCSSNFDVIRAKYGKSDREWRSILIICGSAENSLVRE